jgi:hypothetical protein
VQQAIVALWFLSRTAAPSLFPRSAAEKKHYVFRITTPGYDCLAILLQGGIEIGGILQSFPFSTGGAGCLIGLWTDKSSAYGLSLKMETTVRAINNR